MNQHLTPQELAVSRFIQILFDLWNDAAPLALKVTFLVTVGILLVSVIVAGFMRNQEKYAERRATQSGPEAATDNQLREAQVISITRSRRRTNDGKNGGGAA